MPVHLVLAPNWFCRGATAMLRFSWTTSRGRQSPGECECRKCALSGYCTEKCTLRDLKLDQVTALKVCDWL